MSKFTGKGGFVLVDGDKAQKVESSEFTETLAGAKAAPGELGTATVQGQFTVYASTSFALPYLVSDFVDLRISPSAAATYDYLLEKCQIISIGPMRTQNNELSKITVQFKSIYCKKVINK